ncbi:MAG: hypothetical protein ACK5HC_12760 [Dolichospermum sp.]
MALKIVVGAREQGTGNREQGTGFGQLYFSLLVSVFFRSLTYLRTYTKQNETRLRGIFG